MPIASSIDRQAGQPKFLYVSVERGNHLIALRDRQRSTRAKIVLDINDDESVLTLHRFPL
jgi:hypothetical protein